MIQFIYNKLKSATQPYTSFSFGVEVEQNLAGTDSYPLTHCDLPILFEVTNLDRSQSQVSARLTLYVLEQRVEKTKQEELIQLEKTYKLAMSIIAQLEDSISNISLLTYTGTVDNNFSDDCNGYKVDFNLSLTYSIC